MASTIPNNPSNQTIYLLLPKISDADPDFRFMALSDLHTVLNTGKQDILAHDFSTAARTVDLVVKSLDDQNGEVQNQAIKVLGPLVKKLPGQLVAPMMEKLSGLKLKNSVDNSVAYLALRTVIEAFPRPIPGVNPGREVQEAYASISRILIPRFLGRHTSLKDSKSASLLTEGVLASDEVPPDSVDVVIEVVRCFGTLLNVIETEALQDAVINLLEKERSNSPVKKRAVVALSMLAHYLSPEMLNKFIARATTALASSEISPVTRRLYINVLGSMARSIPQRFGRHVNTLTPYILQVLSEDELQARLDEVNEGHADSGLEFDEVREAALVALEAFLASCPTQMRPFTDDALTACLRYLKFDPNYAQDDDEDMEVDDEEDDDDDAFDDDDEFEEDAGFDDDDDASWKVRRCAAKALHTIISTRSSGDLLDNGVLYGRAAPALVKRFSEREENVRLEVFSALSLLVRKTGEGIIPDFSLDSQNEYLSLNPPSQSRKRRRQSSAAGASAFALSLSSGLPGTGLTSPTTEKIPASGPRADLARLSPSIVKGATKLLKGKLIPTKQAVVTLFDDMVAVQRGGLSSYFDQIMDPILDSIRQSSSSGNSSSLSGTGGTASATVTTLRIAALRLVGDIARNHSSSVLQPYLTKIVVGVTSAVHDRFYKLSAEAIQAAEEVIKAITPPRSRLTAQKYKSELSKLYTVVMDRVSSNDADTEVRNKALHALGTLLSRTSGGEGTPLLPDADRRAALSELLKRLNAETTRLAAVRAIDTVAALATDGSFAFEDQWVQQVATELAAQLRKANRSLRGSSVQALNHLVHSPAAKSNFSDQTVQAIVAALVPVITNNDAQLLGPGLLVLARLVARKPQLVLTPELIASLCELLRSTVAGSVLDSLLVLVSEVGSSGLGQPLMGALLKDVGVNGDPAVVGKVIGTLLVASGDTAGVTLDSFTQEIKANAQDPARASLALAVLGEAGLRLGTKFPVQPKIFLDQFSSSLGKVSIAAAVALGRAGAGNIPAYLPVILKDLRKPGPTQYLLLQSVKEVLQQAAVSQTDIGEFADAVWGQLLAAADAEDNKAVCAECVGRLVIIDPHTYMAKLQGLLRDNSPVIRAIAVQALRYTLPDDNEAFDMILKTYLVDMLRTMLDDSDMEIRRHAMSTLNSAAHNKPELIHGQLGQLMPYVMKESVIKPELIREVMMGPFKHMVDDGLEVRKAAYETLYALMETAFSRISIIDLYDRIIAGLRDDNDIRGLCNLMVSKLVFIDPDETTRRLDAIAEAFRATLSTKLKDSAVKQEIEKQEEANKSVLRVTLLLGEKLKSALNTTGSGANGANQVWTSYWDWVHKDTNFQSQIKMLREENKELSVAGSS
ncbi:TIP120-domain-containing protein [Coniochaeta ligniaria NRRL 30616]|uniref:TIP120-domain-containing protein n=1 Tax=Coniochaeta ligniaria NRRL 30616 TaxID=1408157 RepID=A0A1J7JKI6_9PEZI|nr:TIP120-domain-containing protein [Coniochaeta ligniaria NRRL 30616]